MSATINIRNVPVEIHREMKARAARVGMSLSDYMLQELHHIVEVPTPEEMKARLERLPPVHTALSSEEAVRAERDSR
jgi:plasmid stability protein